jgi:hypothetical protein
MGYLYSMSEGTLSSGAYRNIEPAHERLVEHRFPAHYDNKKRQPNCAVHNILHSEYVKKGKANCRQKQTSA